MMAASTGRSGGGHFERPHFARLPHVLALAALFLRAACGARCWQADRVFANLCIDDPWLFHPLEL